MSSAFQWLFVSSPAVIVWLLFLWAERSHYNRQRRKGALSASPAFHVTDSV